jgi:predicted transcriptional regulator
MAMVYTPEELLRRADRIRLPAKRLSELAGVSESIWAHWRDNPGAAKLSTLSKLSEALINEERALYEYLLRVLAPIDGDL